MEGESRRRAVWNEEKLRYRVLRSIYEHAGADCTHSVTGAEIGVQFPHSYDHLLRTLRALEEYGLVFWVEDRPCVCITPKGIRYIERAAGRRRSIRLPLDG